MQDGGISLIKRFFGCLLNRKSAVVNQSPQYQAMLLINGFYLPIARQNLAYMAIPAGELSDYL